MSENKAKLNDSLKIKGTPKNFKKNPINGTKFTLMVSSAKGGVGKSTFAINLAFAIQKKGKIMGLMKDEIREIAKGCKMSLLEGPRIIEGKSS